MIKKMIKNEIKVRVSVSNPNNGKMKVKMNVRSSEFFNSTTLTSVGAGTKVLMAFNICQTKIKTNNENREIPTVTYIDGEALTVRAAIRGKKAMKKSNIFDSFFNIVTFCYK